MDINKIEIKILKKLLSNPDALKKQIYKINHKDFNNTTVRNVIKCFEDNPNSIAYYTPSKEFFAILLRKLYTDEEELNKTAMVLESVANNDEDTSDLDLLIKEIKNNRICQDITRVINKNINLINPATIDIAYENLIKDLLELPISANDNAFLAKVREINDTATERALDILTPPKNKIKTNIKAFDIVTGGFEKGELTTISAGTGSGKSILMLWMAEQMAENDYNCLYFTIEMSSEANLNRYHAMQTGFSSLDIANKSIPDNKKKEYIAKLIAAVKIKSAREALIQEALSYNTDDLTEFANNATRIANKYQNRKGKVFIIDIDTCTPSRIDQEIQKILINTKIDCVFIDFINVMEPNIPVKDRTRDLGNIARDLKRLARKHNVLIYTAAQLDTSTLSNEKFEEIVPDKIKYSRAISENSDWVIAFHRTLDDKINNIIKLQLIKHRHSSGCTALIKFNFDTLECNDLGFADESFVPNGYNKSADRMDSIYAKDIDETYEPPKTIEMSQKNDKYEDPLKTLVIDKEPVGISNINNEDDFELDL